MAGNEAWRTASRSPYWHERDARAVVDAWRRSGETLSGFCRTHGLSPQRLSRWAARLDRDPAVRFHPVRLTDAGAGAARAILEIQLPGGAMVRLPAGFALDDLRRILSAFESASGC